jgi:tetratricopeptide (TPR) repeat protein
MKPIVRLSLVLVLCALPTRAADSPTVIQWTARATTGNEVRVPIADKVTVVTFLRPGQEQSDAAVKQIAESSAPNAAAQVIVIISGQIPPDAVQKFIEADKIAWPVVLDADYALSGKMSVRVWPTTLVIAGNGTQVAHLAGLPPSFAADLSAYSDFASRKIDQSALASRLTTTRQAVADSPEQAASRHARIALALLDKEQFDQAATEIEEGLKLAPNDLSLRVARVRMLLKQKKPDAALTAAEQLNDLAPPWQVNLLRAEALIALGRWPDARLAAADAIKLNPYPSSAYYLSGQICAHEKDWERAADAFRRAYEATQSERHP